LRLLLVFCFTLYQISKKLKKNIIIKVIYLCRNFKIFRYIAIFRWFWWALYYD
jgi:hypothetical protein